MSDTGRYYVRNAAGRLFCIEPIAERDQRIDGQVFTNGGISGDAVKNAQRGGSIRAEDSIITPDNGFVNITTLPPGVSPMDYIESLERNADYTPPPARHDAQDDVATLDRTPN